jgi:hypothetical protein
MAFQQMSLGYIQNSNLFSPLSKITDLQTPPDQTTPSGVPFYVPGYVQPSNIFGMNSRTTDLQTPADNVVNAKTLPFVSSLSNVSDLPTPQYTSFQFEPDALIANSILDPSKNSTINTQLSKDKPVQNISNPPPNSLQSNNLYNNDGTNLLNPGGRYSLGSAPEFNSFDVFAISHWARNVARTSLFCSIFSK